MTSHNPLMKTSDHKFIIVLRLLAGLPLLGFGLLHFVKPDQFREILMASDIPMIGVNMYAVPLAEVLGGLLLLLGLFARLGGVFGIATMVLSGLTVADLPSGTFANNTSRGALGLAEIKRVQPTEIPSVPPIPQRKMELSMTTLPTNERTIEELFDEEFGIQGTGAFDPNVSPDQQAADRAAVRREAETQAKRLGRIGGADRMGEVVEDPTYKYRLADYEKDLAAWQAPTDPMASAETRGAYPSRPVQNVTREALRRRYGGEAAFGAFDKTADGRYVEHKLTDAEYNNVATRAKLAGKRGLTGTFSNNASRRELGLAENKRDQPKEIPSGPPILLSNVVALASLAVVFLGGGAWSLDRRNQLIHEKSD